MKALELVNKLAIRKAEAVLQNTDGDGEKSELYFMGAVDAIHHHLEDICSTFNLDGVAEEKIREHFDTVVETLLEKARLAPEEVSWWCPKCRFIRNGDECINCGTLRT